MGEFRYRSGGLMCEGVSLSAVARRYGTPCYVTCARAIRTAVESVRTAFDRFSPLICYAMKANTSYAVLRSVAREGCGVEVVSGGELWQALRAGIPPAKIVFSGVGKTEEEIASAIRRRILLFNVESIPELHLIAAVARRRGVRAPVALRINPNVDAHTHRYITTGTNENKFGIDFRQAEGAFREAARLRGIDLAGIHCHIGSQITTAGPFVASIRRLNGLLDRLLRFGIRLRIRNVGGGFGISYRPGQPRLDVGSLACRLAPHLGGRDMLLILEPGRFIVGEAGALVARVVYVKKGVRRTFVIVDAGMDNLIRPCLYEAHHEIWPVKPRRGSVVVDVVGPVCESADFFGQRRRMAPLVQGDTIAILGAGAYGSAMASNYNGRRRAVEVMVDGRETHVVRRRQSYEDLVKGEKV